MLQFLVLSAVVETIILKGIFPNNVTDFTVTWLCLCLATLKISLYAVYVVGIYPYFFSPLRHLPGPKDKIPLINHGWSQFRQPLGEDYLHFLKTIPNDGIIHYRGFLNQDQLLLTNPKALADVLVTKAYNFEKPSNSRSFLRRVLGDGLVVVEGDVHKEQRRLVLPSFSYRHVKDLYPVFWAKAVTFTQKIAKNNLQRTQDGDVVGVVEIDDWSTKVTLDIIGLAAIGRDFNTLENSNDPLAKVYKDLARQDVWKALLFAAQCMGTKYLPKIILPRTDRWFTQLTDNTREICREFVREKRKANENGKADVVDLLSKLAETTAFSDDMLVDQLLTFLAAGHETASSTFTWLVYLLAINPDVQTRLRAEISSAIPHSPTAETDLSTLFSSLPLLNAVINETIRLYPTVPLTIRQSNCATTILSTAIPKWTDILIVPWAINRSPDLWGHDAEAFKPERWLDSPTGKLNSTGGAESNFSLLTFLAGPRSCIGQGFARGELRALTAAFVGAFEVRMPKGEEGRTVVPHGTLTNKVKDGLRLEVKVVKRWED